MTDLTKLPLYQSHKRVRAVKFVAVEHMREHTELVLENGEKISVTPEWVEKHEPMAPGYFVVYADGYQSYSPVEAFESGYWLIGHREGRRRSVIQQVVLELQERITGKGNTPEQWHEAVTELMNAYERAEQLTRSHGT